MVAYIKHRSAFYFEIVHHLNLLLNQFIQHSIVNYFIETMKKLYLSNSVTIEDLIFVNLAESFLNVTVLHVNGSAGDLAEAG